MLPGNRNICVQDSRPERGRFKAPETPNLGLDLNEEFVRRHSTFTALP